MEDYNSAVLSRPKGIDITTGSFNSIVLIPQTHKGVPHYCVPVEAEKASYILSDTSYEKAIEISDKTGQNSTYVKSSEGLDEMLLDEASPAEFKRTLVKEFAADLREILPTEVYLKKGKEYDNLLGGLQNKWQNYKVLNAVVNGNFLTYTTAQLTGKNKRVPSEEVKGILITNKMMDRIRANVVYLRGSGDIIRMIQEMNMN